MVTLLMMMMMLGLLNTTTTTAAVGSHLWTAVVIGEAIGQLVISRRRREVGLVVVVGAA